MTVNFSWDNEIRRKHEILREVGKYVRSMNFKRGCETGGTFNVSLAAEIQT